MFRHVNPMNWQQLHALATPQERQEIVVLLLQRLEAQQRRLIWIPWGLKRDQRHAAPWHFVHDRRQPQARRWRALYLATFTAILGTVSTATLLMSIHLPSAQGILLVMLYDLALLALLIFKPYRRLRQLITAN